MELFSKKQQEAAARKANALEAKMKKMNKKLDEMVYRYTSLKGEIADIQDAINRLQNAFYLSKRAGEYVTADAAKEYDKKEAEEEINLW